MRVRAAAFALAVTLCGGCSEPRVELSYRFEPSTSHQYEWRFEAVTETDTPNEQSVRRSGLVVEITETISRSKKPGQIQVQLQLVPKQATFEGKPGGPPPETSVIVELDRQGRPLQVAPPQGKGPQESTAQAGAGSELERLISEMRPVLPTKAVGIGDTWDAGLSIRSDPASSLALKGRGKLQSFTLAEGRKLANITVRRSGTASTQQAAGRATVLLTGSTRVSSTAVLDIENGVLVRDSSTSTSTFDMTLAGGGKAGVITISVKSSLELID